ncbi:uncharacterized protein EI90DRAFT_3153759 [Cantharellus anzutake]|uniref:uncharacterized protein n=1 Tax=Cantharellus anzutake TaxID=1750568 RepID=UPI0019053AB2|nr:uncharacterized protein EI90DRAFT_3153759 [Cantharellus anzutake]KAF8333605.1 hypothetical protein EI90DRAFT_3153759 [Cantharellus anzutake]
MTTQPDLDDLPARGPGIALPPYSYIILKSSNERIAAGSSVEFSALISGKFDLDRPKLDQAFHILPDGSIRLSNGKYTSPGHYEDEVDIGDNPYQWRILWSPKGYTIHHQNGRAWTFMGPNKPIEIPSEADPDRKEERQLIDFVLDAARPVESDDEPDETLQPIFPQATSKIIITGARLPRQFSGRGPPQFPQDVQSWPNRLGPLPARLEIHDFVKNEKFFSLYVQALKRLQQLPEDQMESYYQVAGLHGFPLVHWNQSNVGNGIYCRHATPIFATWHRPYVALFEQLISQQALEIAGQYKKDQDEWLEAALDLRQPFWDWARPGGAVPPDILISRSTLRIITPKGPRNVENPFLYYAYRTGDKSTGSFPPEYKEWTRTIRHPYSDRPIQEIRNYLTQAQEQITMHTHDLFEINDWEEFSNKKQTQTGSTSSLEALHDTIHVLVGVTDIFLVPYDPLFFLHHAQVDRLLSLWKTLHEDQWVSGPELTEDLTPFWNSNNSYWNSDLIRSHEVFNHTYPEYLDVKGDPRHHIRETINQLYGGSSNRVFKGLSHHSHITSWSIRFRIKPFVIRQSFSIVVFFGEVPKDPHSWFSSSDLVGTYDVFITYLPEDCDNCRSHEHEPIEGFVHLTSTIQDKIPHVREDQVPRYLEQHLRLGLRRVDGTVAKLDKLDFEAKVLSRRIKPATHRGPARFHVGEHTTHQFDIKHGVLW